MSWLKPVLMIGGTTIVLSLMLIAASTVALSYCGRYVLLSSSEFSTEIRTLYLHTSQQFGIKPQLHYCLVGFDDINSLAI